MTVTGVTLSSVDTGVTLTATRTSGDSLTAGVSAPFNVIAGFAAEPTTPASAVMFGLVANVDDR